MLSQNELKSLLLHYKISSDPRDLIGSNRCYLFTIRIVLCSKSQIFPSQCDSFTKTQQSIEFQGLFKETNQVKGKGKTTSATFYKPAQYWINKIFVQTKKPVFERLNCAILK